MQLRTIFTVGSAAAVAALLGSASVASAVDADAVYADIKLAVHGTTDVRDGDGNRPTYPDGSKRYQALNVEVGDGVELNAAHLVNDEWSSQCGDMEVDIDLAASTITVANVGTACVFPQSYIPMRVELDVTLKSGATIEKVLTVSDTLFEPSMEATRDLEDPHEYSFTRGVNAGTLTATWTTCEREDTRNVAKVDDPWKCHYNAGPDLNGAAVFSFTLLAVEPDDEETPTPTPTPTPSGGTDPDNGSGDGDIEPAESASPVPAKPAFTG